MDLNTFRPIAKKFGLIERKTSLGIVEFYINIHKYNCVGDGQVCTYYTKENLMGSPTMKVFKMKNGGFAFQWGCDANIRTDVIFEKPKYVELALTEMFKRLEKFKRR
jgi:hypothetical protein